MKRSQTAPHSEQPVTAEGYEGALVLPLESEGPAGAISAGNFIAAAVCTTPPKPLSSLYILYPHFFLFEGAPTRSLQSS